MAVSSVLTFGPWGGGYPWWRYYPVQGLGIHGGAEEMKPSSIRFPSEQVNKASGDPGCSPAENPDRDACAYRDQDDS